MFWLYVTHYLGVDYGSTFGRWVWYNFWSGFGSDLTEFAIIGSIILGLRHINCHVKGCWRVGNHALDGTPYKVCRKHHPDIPNKAPTHEEMMDFYNNGGNNAREETGTINQET